MSGDPGEARRSRRRVIHRWFRRAFLVWGVVSTVWLANSVRTQGVAPALLRGSDGVRVEDQDTSLEFWPVPEHVDVGLIFICGAGIAAHAYAPLLRPVAEQGYPVIIVRLPYRFAPLASHKAEAIARVGRARGAHPNVSRWVIAGHSQGGALTARVAQADDRLNAGYVLIGTTHPKETDLSSLSAHFTKVYGTDDGVAPADRVVANKRLLPPQTEWVVIEGGNHSQFGHYGRQLLDSRARISREAQQAATREAILNALRRAGNGWGR